VSFIDLVGALQEHVRIVERDLAADRPLIVISARWRPSTGAAYIETILPTTGVRSIAFAAAGGDVSRPGAMTRPGDP
jgi:hypothetical protein